MLFGDKRDPVSRQPLADPDDYARMFLNPGDNAGNLSAEYLKSLENLPERQRKRFFEGVYIDDLDGALFSYEMIARARVAEFALGALRAASWSRSIRRAPPAATTSAPTRSASWSPREATTATPTCSPTARCATRRRRGAAPRSQAYHEFEADRIVAEENFGGEMVRFVIRAADANAPVQVISASRGKVLRAEPVSALYEQGLVHHVGRFAVLEDQLCAFTTAGYRGEGSPDHADALVFAITELMLKDSAPIIEFYRRRAGGTGDDKPADRSVRVPGRRSGDGRSGQLERAGRAFGVHGLSGAYYVVGADRVVR